MKIAYARVSTRNQNLEMQLDFFRKSACERVFEEKRSAFKDLPELGKAIEFMRSGDVLCVWSLDRLGRTMLNVLGNVKKIHDKGCTLVTHVGAIDTGKPEGKILVAAYSMLSEIEINLKKERTAAGLEAARSRGMKPGRKPGLTPEAKKMALTAKKLYQSQDPVYSVREITDTLKISSRTFYKYLRTQGIEPGEREF